MGETVEKKPRGFAALKLKDPQRFHEITSAGGSTAQKLGKAHRWTSAEATLAGKKGGVIASTPERMREIGRRGGLQSAARRQKGKEVTDDTEDQYKE